MIVFKVRFFWLMYLILRFTIAENLIVSTLSGPVRGQFLTTLFENKSYYSFKGIPYATPPKYDLRFLPPKPVVPWTEIRDCFSFGNSCLQFNPIKNTEIKGDEDCLFLNIYTPNVNSTRLKAVMVYIHGGGFFFGSGDDDLQGPDFLINEGVVLVTLNYRLGVMGWMSLGTPEYSGNQGLKDQQLALRWINANIHLFGGDSTKITIFGQSAGSSSCHFHILAPGSRGLFQQAIEMSFTFDIWSIFEKGHHMDMMYTFAEEQKYAATNYAELISFLKTVDPELITTRFKIVQYYVDKVPVVITSKWLPVLENSKALQPFLQKTPAELMLMKSYNTHINVMTGFTTAESLFFNAPNCLNPSTLNNLNENFQIELPSMYFNRKYNTDEYRKVAQIIRNYYFPNGTAVNANKQTIHSYEKMMTHVYEIYQIDQRVKLLARRTEGNTFYYRFGIEDQCNYYKIIQKATSLVGAAHADDICYVFNCNYRPEMYANITKGSRPYELIKLMTGLYTNFAQLGHPLPNSGLQPVKADRLMFLDITNSGVGIGENPCKDHIKFWNDLLLDNQHLLNHNVNAYLDEIIRIITSV